MKKSARAQNRVDNRYVDIKFMNENDKGQIWDQIFFHPTRHLFNVFQCNQLCVFVIAISDGKIKILMGFPF